MPETVPVQDHRKRHVELHKEVEELFVDFIENNDKKSYLKITIHELLEWSFHQTLEPDHEYK